MTDKNDPHNDLSTPGDPKDDHMSSYATTPEGDQVGTQNKGIGGIQNQEDHPSGEGAQTFKGNDPLVTRDPEAMAHTPEEAAYAGAQAVPGNIGSVPVTAAVPADLTAGMVTTPDPFLARDIDPNPNYTPPSEEVSSHPNEGAADVPAGAPDEQYLESTLNNTVSDKGGKK
ncbi:hypothetical protein [Deinococcus sp.]|uniref:hypothetical protein n=1 Tax=Deinococcus sp. TaxID=47478 RepID=UPI003B5CE1A6